MVLIALLATVIGSQREPASTVFERHTAEIKNAEIIEFEGWIFSSARHRYSGNSTNAETVAIEAAKTVADSQIVSASLDITNGKPNSISAKLEKSCRERVALLIKQKLKAEGLISINEDAGAGLAGAVRALPAASLKKKPLDWSQAVNLLENQASSVEDYAVLCEINACLLPVEIATNRFCESIKSKYSVYIEWHPTPIADGWYSVDYPITEQQMNGFSLDELFQLLARRPFDPLVTDYISRRFANANLSSVASMVRAWPKISWREEPEVDARLKQLGEILPIENRSKRIGILKLLAHAGDSWPVTKVDISSCPALILFKEGRIKEALVGFVDEIGRSPSADTANYLAACFLALKDFYLSSCFSNLALTWEPTHPYAVGNLMLSKQRLGHVDEAHVLAKRIIDDPNSNEWAKGKANDVLISGQRN